MAEIKGKFNGKEVMYEESIYNNLLHQFKDALPSHSWDANYVDTVAVIASLVTENAGKKVEVVINGASIIIDGVTNTITSSDPDSIYALLRGMVIATAGFASAFVITGGGKYSGTFSAFALGNTASNWFADNIWDKYLGPSTGIKKVEGTNIELGVAYKKTYSSDGTLKNTVENNFVNTRKDLQELINKETTTSTSFKFADSDYFIYDAENKNIIINQNISNNDLDYILKLLPENFLPKINGIELVENYLHDFYNDNSVTKKEIITKLKAEDKSMHFAVHTLEKFITLKHKDELEEFELTDLTKYSEEYLADRVNMYSKYLQDDTNGLYYYDDQTKKGIGTNQSEDPTALSRVVFVDDDYSYSPFSGKSNAMLNFYGNEKDNNIVAQSRSDNRVEGGLGSDNITTGMGDDTIYTNANIEDKYDNETSTTHNYVYAGDGADTIYGSNGTDIIYTDSDSSNPNQYSERDYVEGRGSSDVIYGGGGNDTLYGDRADSHADISGDYIVGGRGKDTIHGSDGEDTIYGDNEKNDGNGGSASFDSDTIYGYGGNDTVYGGNDSDTIYGGAGVDTIHGGDDDDNLFGGNDTDYLYGDRGDDTLTGGDDNSSDILIGGEGEDKLVSQAGDDVLVGGYDLNNLYTEKEKDYLIGGAGYDTYLVSDKDVINDSDGSGLIMFNEESLSGKKTKIDEYSYKDKKFIYEKDGLDLKVTEKLTGEAITIENFENGALGIYLDLASDITINISDPTVSEGDDGDENLLVFEISASRDLKEGEDSHISSSTLLDRALDTDLYVIIKIKNITECYKNGTLCL